MSHRADQKNAAKEARLAKERELADAARRRRVLTLGGGALALAAIVALVVVLASSGGGGGGAGEGGDVTGADLSAEMFGDTPEDTLSLGDPNAPLTLVEYADLQCPACRAYSDDVFPVLMERYVVPGKLRMELRLQSFLGPDSVTAAGAVAAAALQDRAWRFLDLFYRNQGIENSGYVTDEFLRKIGGAVEGLDVEKMMADRNGSEAQKMVSDGKAEFAAFGFTGTPSFRLGPSEAEAEPFEVQALEPSAFTPRIDELLAEAERTK